MNIPSVLDGATTTEHQVEPFFSPSTTTNEHIWIKAFIERHVRQAPVYGPYLWARLFDLGVSANLSRSEADINHFLFLQTSSLDVRPSHFSPLYTSAVIEVM